MTHPPEAPATPNPSPRVPLTTPFFYGWVIVACASVAAFLSSGITNVVMSVMLKPISEETGWSRTAISATLATGALLGGLGSPLAGRLVDRYGARLLMAPGGLISGILYLAVSTATAFPFFFIIHVANRAITTASIAGVVGQTAVANWFFYRRPRAMGIVAMTGSLGASVMAIVAQFLLEHASWRAVMVTYGVLTLLLVVGPNAYLMRRRPEDLGLTLDGFTPERMEKEAVSGGGRRGRRAEDEVNWTLAEAIRTPALWLIIASLGVASFGITSVGVHQVAYLTDRGIAAGVAAAVLSVYTLSSATANLMWGFVTEHFDERTLNVWALSLAAAAIWFLTTVETPAAAFGFAVCFGLFARGESALINILLAHYYGRQNFGAITGFTRPFQAGAGALGPVVAGLTFDLTGSYIRAFYALIGMFLFAALLMFLARKPAPPHRGTLLTP